MQSLNSVKEWLTWQRTVMILMALFVVSSMYTNYVVIDMSSQTRKLVESNTESIKQGAKSLTILEEATSAKTRREGDARLAAAIKQLDCNHQYTIEKAVRLEFPEASVMSQTCIQYFTVNPPPP